MISYLHFNGSINLKWKSIFDSFTEILVKCFTGIRINPQFLEIVDNYKQSFIKDCEDAHNIYNNK